jgi:hypothetical protein
MAIGGSIDSPNMTDHILRPCYITQQPDPVPSFMSERFKPSTPPFTCKTMISSSLFKLHV